MTNCDAIKMLKELEWSAPRKVPELTQPACPRCGGFRPGDRTIGGVTMNFHGHSPGCWLAEVISPEASDHPVDVLESAMKGCGFELDPTSAQELRGICDEGAGGELPEVGRFLRTKCRGCGEPFDIMP